MEILRNVTINRDICMMWQLVFFNTNQHTTMADNTMFSNFASGLFLEQCLTIPLETIK